MQTMFTYKYLLTLTICAIINYNSLKCAAHGYDSNNYDKKSLPLDHIDQLTADVKTIKDDLAIAEAQFKHYTAPYANVQTSIDPSTLAAYRKKVELFKT